MNNKSECCGCTACQQICPPQCITMHPDEEGFLYPKINESRCVHCKKCEAVCPIHNPLLPKGKTEVYVGYANNQEIRRASSSGGIFSLAAEYVLKRNGVVFGAAFDDAFGVHHICIETEEELCKLRGSKYVQSSLEDTYAQAKKCLLRGRWVLFSGTACQIAGLKKYLGKEYDYLLTIDVLCHGVPSPKVWKLYLEDQERKHNARITSISFRDKKLGWKLFSMKIQFENGREYSLPFTKDPFMNMFLSNIDLRPSCYDCRFKAFPRSSDMTIGDCWGIEHHLPELDDDQGTSVILVHTEKGQEVLNELQNDLMLQKAELDQVLPPSADSRKSVAVHPMRDKYWADLQAGKSFDNVHNYVKQNIVKRVLGYLYIIKLQIGKSSCALRKRKDT